jgi:uncharacterized membrane protein YhaH (DUF805 family)
MNKLKTKFGKYFQFKNTINGTDYFLRGLALILFLIPIGIFVGIGVALITTNAVLAGLLVGVGALLLIPMFWFSIATTYKRINGFFPSNAGWLTAVTFLFSLIVEGINPNNSANMDLENPLPYINPFDSPLYILLLLLSIVWSFYLLFGNSKVKKHIG